jgi:hypothetical protein
MPPPDCKPQTLCYTPDRAMPCAQGDEAAFQLCQCGGKGCTFYGQIVSGPNEVDGKCCYDLYGDCVPNP